MSWDQLVAILIERRDEILRNDEPVACPNDGEPLTVGADGQLFCRFDGWRP